LLLFLVALSFVATMPLRFAIDHLPIPALPVQINHVQGTLVNGRAMLMMKNLPLPPAIGAKLETLMLAWEWCPSFATGLLSVCIEADTELAQGVFTVALSPTATQLHNVSLQSELKKLSVPIANRPTDLSGRLQLSLMRLTLPFSTRLPSQVQGDVILQNLTVGIFELGNFDIDLSSNENETLTADIKGEGSLLSVQGIANLNREQQYRYSLDIESGNTLVRNFLSSRGQANDQGGYRLAKTGTLSL